MLGFLGVTLPDAVITALLLAFFVRDVTRARLERFAMRQDLEITFANGPLVINYLAATRRWRVAGFIVGSVLAAGVDFHRGSGLQFGFTGPFLGWFVGASVAEWQLGRRGRDGLRRTALLAARRFTDYLGRLVDATVVAVWSLLLALETDVVITADSGHLQLAAMLPVTIATAAALFLVARRVLVRPQAVAAPDVLAADDAIRSRSLHVLAGSSLVIAALGAAAVLHFGESHVAWIELGREQSEISAAGLVLMVVGILVSVLPTRARRPRWAPAVRISA